jgi:hypothetical protein
MSLDLQNRKPLVGKLMPDTRYSERAREWPRSYTPPELKAIAQSIGRSELPPHTVDQLQEAVKAYQWGRSFDEGEFPPGCKVQSLTRKAAERISSALRTSVSEAHPQFKYGRQLASWTVLPLSS